MQLHKKAATINDIVVSNGLALMLMLLKASTASEKAKIEEKYVNEAVI